MASAFVHRLFTQGHVKYVRFHGDRAADRDAEGVASSTAGRWGGSEFHSWLSLALTLRSPPREPFRPSPMC